MVPLAPTHNRFPLRKNHKYKRPHLVLALTGYFACAYEETSMAMTNVWDGLCWLQFRAVGDLGCCWTILYIEKSQRWEKDTKIMVLSLDFVFCQLWSQLLSKWNGFDYYKLEPGDDPFQEEVKLSTFIKLGLKRAVKKKKEHQDKTWPVFVFKHHYYYNTSRNGLFSNMLSFFCTRIIIFMPSNFVKRRISIRIGDQLSVVLSMKQFKWRLFNSF